ncbi:MAG: hypothetical protein QM790_09245 [Nibricoccus sp.]
MLSSRIKWTWRTGFIVALFGSQTVKAIELDLRYAFTEEQRVVVNANEPVKPDKEQKTKLSTKKGKLNLVVGATYIALEDDERTSFYDLAAKKIYHRSKNQKTWTVQSLFSDVYFRVAEFQNREKLSGALRAAGVSNPITHGMDDTFELETLFGLRFPNARSEPVKDLQAIKLKNGLRFVRGEELASCRFSSTEIPVSLRPMFSRALVHLYRTHPEIRQQIVANGKLPQQLSTCWYNMGTSGKTVWELESVKLVEKGTHQAPVQNERIPDGASAVLISRMKAALAPAKGESAPTLESVAKACDQAIAEGRPLDGLLGFFELAFQSGENVSPEIRLRRDTFARDERCQQYIASCDQSTQEACEKAVSLIRGIDRTGLKKDHILDVQLADSLSTLGKLDEAEKLFLNILERNPRLTGVWNDLGDVYVNRYEMPIGWACWDLARQISPSHPMMAQRTNLEKRLMDDFPDFFLPRE